MLIKETWGKGDQRWKKKPQNSCFSFNSVLLKYLVLDQVAQSNAMAGILRDPECLPGALQDQRANTHFFETLFVLRSREWSQKVNVPAFALWMWCAELWNVVFLGADSALTKSRGMRRTIGFECLGHASDCATSYFPHEFGWLCYCSVVMLLHSLRRSSFCDSDTHELHIIERYRTSVACI